LKGKLLCFIDRISEVFEFSIKPKAHVIFFEFYSEIMKQNFLKIDEIKKFMIKEKLIL